MGVSTLGSSMDSMGTSSGTVSLGTVEVGRCSPEGVSPGDSPLDGEAFGDWKGLRWIWKGSLKMSMVGNLTLESSSLRLEEM